MKIFNVLFVLTVSLVTTNVVGGNELSLPDDNAFSVRELLPEEKAALALLHRNLRSANIPHDLLNFERRIQVEREPISLAEIVAQVFILQMFEAYLAYSLQIPTISGPGPSTIFTPWNTPFMALDDALIAKLQNRNNWGAHLQNFIRYHIIIGEDLAPEDLGAQTTVTTANGENVTIERSPDTTRRVFVNGILAVADYDATNGHAYMLDAVLEPAWLTISLLDLVSSNFSTLANLLIAYSLTSMFEGDEGYHILAPTNEALAGLDESSLDAIDLQATLLYHVLTEGPYPTTFTATRNITTLAGESVQFVKSTPPRVVGLINEATIILPDLLAYNGLVHGIDTVLLFPASYSDAPSPVPTTAQTLAPINSTAQTLAPTNSTAQTLAPINSTAQTLAPINSTAR